MIDKKIRILLIEPIFAHTHLIEKMLNLMGYYCVATTTNIEQGVLLNRYGLRSFDVLIMPASMLVLEQSRVSGFKGFNIRNLFLYGCSFEDYEIPTPLKGKTYFKSGLPEYEVLQNFIMSLPKKMRTTSGLEKTLSVRS